MIATRVSRLDWPALAEEVNAYGCAQTSQLLSVDACRSISELYDDAARLPAQSRGYSTTLQTHHSSASRRASAAPTRSRPSVGGPPGSVM